MKDYIDTPNEKLTTLINSLRLCDDPVFRVVVNDNPAVAKAILAPILGRDDFEVINVRTQVAADSISGRGVVFDCVAIFSDGTHVNLEMQKDPRDASPERLRYYAGRFDGTLLKKGDEFTDLPKAIVVFLIDGDPIGLGQARYVIRRVIYGDDGNSIGLHEDGSSIVVANMRRCDEGTPLGTLMHDLLTTDTESIRNPVLAQAIQGLKYDKEAKPMNELLQQYKNEAIEEGRALGLEQGLEQGQVKGRLEAMRLVIGKGFLSVEQAAEALGMTTEELRTELDRIQSAD